MNRVYLSKFLYYSGCLALVKLYNNLTNKRLIILTFHRVGHYDKQKNNALNTLYTSPQTFEAILNHLLKHYNVISMCEYYQRRTNFQKLCRDSVVITFDDGYRDAYENAFPKLREKELPFVLFIPSNIMYKELDFWWDRLYYYCHMLEPSDILRALSTNKSECQSYQNITKIVEINQSDRRQMAVDLTSEFSNLENSDRALILKNLDSLLPRDKRWTNDGNKTISLNEIKEISSYGVEIGSHTESHCFLDRVSKNIAQKEIFRSKQILEQKLNKEIQFFSYPGGKWTPLVRKLIKAAGYKCACVTEQGINRCHHDPFLLKRINIWEDLITDSDGRFQKSLFETRLVLSDLISKIGMFKAKFSNKVVKNPRNIGKVHEIPKDKYNEIEKKSVQSIQSQNRIKILYIIDYLYGFGGTEKHLLQLVRLLDKNKFTCYIFALESDSQFLRHYRNSCEAILPMSLNKIYGWQAINNALRLINFLKKEQIDIVQTFHSAADIYGSVISRIAKVPLVISSRRDLGSYRTGLYQIMDRLTRPLIHRYLSVCEEVTKSLVEQGIPTEIITRIYNGVDLTEWPESNGMLNCQMRKRLNIDNNSFVIGNISHFRPEKGHDVFLKVIRRLIRQIPGLRVLALGGGSEGDFIHHVKQDSLLREIVIIDWVKEIKEYLSVFDVACLTPIKNEGFSNALLEEMAGGIPVVATDVGGNSEAVVDGETGFIVPPNDVDALERAILKLYHNPELRKKMGLKGRKRIETYFTIDKMIQSIDNYYVKTFQELEK